MYPRSMSMYMTYITTEKYILSVNFIGKQRSVWYFKKSS